MRRSRFTEEQMAKMLRAKVRDLESMLCRKTAQVETLKEAVEVARSKYWLPPGSSSVGDGGR